MTIIERLGAILAALASLPQMAQDIAAIKAAQAQGGAPELAQALDDIKAIVINIQAQIGQE